MDGNEQAGVWIRGQDSRQCRMAVQEEAVADDLDLSFRPVPPHQPDEFRQLRMDGGFPAQQGEARDGDATAVAR